MIYNFQDIRFRRPSRCAQKKYLLPVKYHQSYCKKVKMARMPTCHHIVIVILYTFFRLSYVVAQCCAALYVEIIVRLLCEQHEVVSRRHSKQLGLKFYRYNFKCSFQIPLVWVCNQMFICSFHWIFCNVRNIRIEFYLRKSFYRWLSLWYFSYFSTILCFPLVKSHETYF